MGESGVQGDWEGKRPSIQLPKHQIKVYGWMDGWMGGWVVVMVINKIAWVQFHLVRISFSSIQVIKIRNSNLFPFQRILFHKYNIATFLKKGNKYRIYYSSLYYKIILVKWPSASAKQRCHLAQRHE